MRDTNHVVDLTYFENVSGTVEVDLRSVASPKNEGYVVTMYSYIYVYLVD